MTLIEILKEAQQIENGEYYDLHESKKKTKKSKMAKIRKEYYAKKSQALKVVNKLKPSRNKINWSDDIKNIRTKLLIAFVNNDPDKVLDMMAKPDGFKVIGILKALETAHGGYKKLEAKAKDKKYFAQTVYGYIDELEN